MCRNIKRLYNLAPAATEEEIRASAVQYVRKISGMQKPSQANQAAFDAAVAQIADIAVRLVRDELQTLAKPRDREDEARRAKERGRKREERMRARILAETEGA